MNGDDPSQREDLRLLFFTERCPDCTVEIGDEHDYNDEDGGCDVARCLVTGLQRLMCGFDHDYGRDVWTGWPPGHLDCERLGWMFGPGLPDLVRLFTTATWDVEQQLWMPPA